MPATTEKPPTLARELAALERMTAAELRDKYAAVFGEPATSGNRAWLARGSSPADAHAVVWFATPQSRDAPPAPGPVTDPSGHEPPAAEGFADSPGVPLGGGGARVA